MFILYILVLFFFPSVDVLITGEGVKFWASFRHSKKQYANTNRLAIPLNVKTLKNQFQ